MTRRLDILIVDDVEDDALLMVEALRDTGHAVDFKWVDRPEALERALDEADWQLVLTDFSMPRFGGLEVLRAVQQRGRDIPVVIVSGTIGEERVVDLLTAGASDCVLKTNLARMKPVVDRVLDDARTRHERREAERRLRASNRALRLLSDVNRAVARAESEVSLLQEACEMLAADGSLPLAWVGVPHKDLEKTVGVIASAGPARSWLDEVRFTWGDGPLGNTPAGTAIRTGRPTWVSESAADPAFLVWCDAAKAHGLRSALALPLHVGGRPMPSVLCMCSSNPDGFCDDERAVLEDVAASLANGLEILHARAEKAEAGRRLQQAQRMEAVGRLAAGVAHDFNNLLAVIAGNVEFLLDDLPGDDPLRDDVCEIRDAAKRAIGLTQQLLAFSREQVLKPEVLDLEEVVADVDRMLRRVIGEDICLVTDLAGDLRKVYVDRGQVEQVLMNLAVNARDAMPGGGTLTIETANERIDPADATLQASAQGDHVRLSVVDTGTGIEPEAREHIFEPFYTTKSRGEGTGLGLATVHGIVRQSGGLIRVHSEIGTGTRFDVLFPVLDGAACTTSRRDSAPPSRPGGGETVLVVEDEEAVRAIVVRTLETAGYRVLAAGSGAEALALRDQHDSRIHLLVTDVIMPGMNGRELAERLCGDDPRMAVLYMSGYTGNTIAARGLVDQTVELLAKPFSRNSLRAKVRLALDGATPEVQSER